MKSTIVPAQITSVEDKVTAKLSLSQLILLIIPVLISGVLFTFIPPFMSMPGFKVSIAIFSFVIAGFLTIRIGERIMLLWIVILFRYLKRPRVYVFNKNDNYLRNQDEIKQESHEVKSLSPKLKLKPIKLNVSQVIDFENMLISNDVNLSYRFNKQGGVYVQLEKNQKVS